MRGLDRLRARVHAWTMPRPAPTLPPPPIREPGALPTLRLVPVPNPSPSGPADLLLIRRGEAFLVTFFELELLVSVVARLRDELARRSPYYAPAEVPPPAEVAN